MPQLINTTKTIRDLEDRYDLVTTLQFINICLQQYNFPPTVKDSILSNLSAITQKRKDSRFYLGVIGEASSGKSTLINAILNYNILVTNVQLGTTTASTFIYKGNSFGIDLYFDNETEDVLSYPKDKNILSTYGYKEEFDHASNVKAILAYATAQEWVSKHLKRVEVHLPIPMLESGLVIVDTPGINAPNERHFSVTAKTVDSLCDAAIVVIPSHSPFSEGLNNFLLEHLNPYLHRCIYVLSMIDQSSRGGRRKLIEVVYQRLCSMLDVASPVLLPVSTVPSMELLGTPVTDMSSLDKEDIEEFTNGFQKLIATTQTILSTQRVYILFERVLNICQLLISDISKQLDVLEKDYQRQHQALLTAVLERPQASAEDMRKKVLLTFKRECANIRLDLEIALRNQEQELCREARWTVDYMNSKDDLKNRLEIELEDVFDDGNSNTKREIDNHIYRMESVVKSCLNSFEQQFTTIYNTLATLGGTIDPVYLKVDNDRNEYRLISSSRTMIGSAISTANDAIEEGDNSLAAGFWVGVGAAILIPGLGLIIGPAVGALIGHFFGPNLDTIKAKVKSELENNIKTSYQKVSKQVLTEFDKSVKHFEGVIGKRITQSFDRYNLLIKEMNNRDEKLKSEMEIKRQLVVKDREKANVLVSKIKVVLKDLRNS